MVALNLHGRRAIVTGASRGIGASIARALDAAGVRSVLVARTDAALREVALPLANAVTFAVDLRDAAGCDDMLRRAPDLLGGAPDILVNNAGAFAIARVDETETAAFDDMLALNVAAPFRLMRALIPALRHAPRAHIVTVGSVADRVVLAGNAAYAASKFAARALHEAVRAELKGTPVRVSLVSPGPTDTPLWDAIDPDNREGFTPRRLMLTADAVADAVLWVLTRPDGVNVDELRVSHA